jgi:hypothetical protein
MPVRRSLDRTSFSLVSPLTTRVWTAVLTVACLAVLVSSAGAFASVRIAPAPCWKQLLGEWYSGKITTVYPLHCYAQAITHLPKDVVLYSDAKQNILAAESAAEKGKPAPAEKTAFPALVMPRNHVSPATKQRTASLLPCFDPKPGRPCSPGTGIRIIDRGGGGSLASSWLWPVVAGCLFLAGLVGFGFWRRPPHVPT